MIIEFLAALFTLLCVYLATKGNIYSWWVGILGLSLYSIVFFNERLYGDFFLQLIFLTQSIYGLYNWNKNKVNYVIKITKLSKLNILVYISLLFSIWLLMNYLLSTYTNASLPLVDSFLTATSLIANWLLAKRKIESWYLWILADTIYVMLFIYKKLYISSVTYFILLIIAIYGYKSWKKLKLKQL